MISNINYLQLAARPRVKIEGEGLHVAVLCGSYNDAVEV